MVGTQENSTNFDSVIHSWMESITRMVNDLVTGLPSDEASVSPAEVKAEEHFGYKAQDIMASAVKNLKTITSSMSTPESIAALLKGAGDLPEILVQTANSSFRRFVEVQQKIVERAGRVGDVGAAYKVEDLDENMFQVWQEVYERELQRFFYIPQVGLTRSYQEHWNRALDKYYIFQTRSAEFMRLLGMPFRQSLSLLQEKISDMAEAGDLPEDSQVYYQMWIKVLEGHFMTLFQGTEYVQSLSDTLSSLADYTTARNAVFEEIAGMLPLARRSELDELAREVHELKKRTRRLEQQTG